MILGYGWSVNNHSPCGRCPNPCVIQFGKVRKLDDHSQPPPYTVTELGAGLDNQWDSEWNGTFANLSERRRHISSGDLLSPMPTIRQNPTIILVDEIATLRPGACYISPASDNNQHMPEVTAMGASAIAESPVTTIEEERKSEASCASSKWPLPSRAVPNGHIFPPIVSADVITSGDRLCSVIAS